MAVTMVRLLTLLPGDAGTCRVTEDGNVMEWKMGGERNTELKIYIMLDLHRRSETLPHILRMKYIRK